MTHTARFAAAFALSSVAVGAAHAQDVRSASESVVACQTLTDPTEKLACYEAAAIQVSQALSEAEVAVETALEVRAPTIVAEAEAVTTEGSAPSDVVETAAENTEAEEEFGRRRLLPSWIPSVSLKLGSDESREKQPNEFAVSVTRIQRNKLGRYFFTTADGHVWRQTQVREVTPPSLLPTTAVLTRSVSGTIRLRFDHDSNHSHKVIRVE